MPKTKPVPDGFHTVTPYIVADDAMAVFDFMAKAFGAQPVHRPTLRPDGTLMHAAMQIGDGRVMVAASSEMAKASPAMIYLYLPDVDAVYAAAIAAGATSIMTPSDMFYGDRSGGVTDMAGNQWFMATHIEDVPEDEIEKRGREMFGKG